MKVCPYTVSLSHYLFPQLASSISGKPLERLSHMRKPRILQKGATYHVTARANRQELIMDPHGMKVLFLATILRAKKRYRFQISNFSILGNHFHLIITPGSGESLSAIMQWILSVFAMAYNRKLGLTGHVWGERFFSKVIEGLKELLRTFEYIDENPVRAGLVARAEQWEYGGLAHHRRGIGGIVEEVGREILALLPLHARLG